MPESDARAVRSAFITNVEDRIRRREPVERTWGDIVWAWCDVDGAVVTAVAQLADMPFPLGNRLDCNWSMRPDEWEFQAWMLAEVIIEPHGTDVSVFRCSHGGIGWMGDLDGFEDAGELALTEPRTDPDVPRPGARRIPLGR